MFKALIELMLGQSGRFLIAQYNEYHVAINLVVIIYGTLLILAHLNLRQITRRMEAVMIGLAREAQPPHDAQHLFRAFRERWKESQADKKLFFPSRNDLWFSMIESGDLIEILNLQKEYLLVVLSKAKILNPSVTLPKQTYRAWELYRHQLLTGIRAHHMEPEVQLEMRRKQTKP